MMPEQIAKQRDSQFRLISVKSALNPALWLVWAGLFGGLTGLWYFSSNLVLMIFFMALAGVPMLCACVVFLYFAIKQPERLQSEEYQLKAETLRMIKTKGGQFTPRATALLQAIHNPARPELPPGGNLD